TESARPPRKATRTARNPGRRRRVDSCDMGKTLRWAADRLDAMSAEKDAGSPAISFAIPYYRGRDYLREAVESVLAQTRPDWELLVVDDCGPEPADDLVASYGDSRIRYHRN